MGLQILLDISPKQPDRSWLATYGGLQVPQTCPRIAGITACCKDSLTCKRHYSPRPFSSVTAYMCNERKWRIVVRATFSTPDVLYMLLGNNTPQPQSGWTMVKWGSLGSSDRLEPARLGFKSLLSHEACRISSGQSPTLSLTTSQDCCKDQIVAGWDNLVCSTEL